jgi:hypothetical protein
MVGHRPSSSRGPQCWAGTFPEDRLFATGTHNCAGRSPSNSRAFGHRLLSGEVSASGLEIQREKGRPPRRRGILERHRDKLEGVVASETTALTELAADRVGRSSRRARTLLGDEWLGSRSKVRSSPGPSLDHDG